MSILGLGLTETKPVVVGAGFWIRSLARALDLLYGYVVGSLAGICGAFVLAILQVLSLADPGWAARFSQARATLMLTSLVGSVFYQTFCEGLFGASVGKLICGLRVLSEDLSPCRLKPALVRSLGYFVDGLVFGVVGYLEMNKTQMEQRHGDHWAKTVVVRNAQVPEGSKRSGGRFVLAFALGTAAWGFPLVVVLVLSALRE